MRKIRVAAVAAGAALLLTACAPAAPGGGMAGELTVYAAASLGPAFEDLAAQFEADNPGIDVRPLVLDGSQVLATQIAEGAPADVFASADEQTMDRVTDLVHAPAVFATNTLAIAVPPGNPAGIEGLADLAGADVTVVLCAAEVPCGAASRALLDRAGIAFDPASEEQNVGAVLAKIDAAEADAGLVYRTDILRGDVDEVAAEGSDEVVNRYPIAALRDARNPDAADAFVALVRGETGQRILAEHGFGAP
ncbi:molybdate ABC transporter substrate-binding protein [Microbacterium sp. JZ31]|uniref:molybdate ABC transporter substrate-binding protein n=1 Tax=Microbacterium sp. JZ31 TaxID=1906274 RepID=UPI00193182E0|nr:molybdate ABC transporter substrate-binding protein [Microbacterium sp. JZ31]